MSNQTEQAERDYRKQLVTNLAKQLKSYGYTVYLPDSRLYGFYTDGTCVVNFGDGYDPFGANFYGNFKGDLGQRTRWLLKQGIDFATVTKKQACYFLAQTPPRHRGGKGNKKLTLDEFMEDHLEPCGYTIFEGDEQSRFNYKEKALL